MFATLPFWLLAVIFLVSGAAIWVAGITLSITTDVLAKRFHLGQALGGLILLAVATNLPELAITASAGIQRHLDLAVGNILGGVALQTVVLVVLDLWGLGRKAPLTYMAASLQLVLEAVIVIAVLVVAIMGSQLPSSLVVARLSPDGLLIALIWGLGLYLVHRARSSLPWQQHGDAPGGEAAGIDVDAINAEASAKRRKADQAESSTSRAVLGFSVAALVTLAAGVAAEESGNTLAGRLGMSGVLFGATILAAATSLPELSTGIQAIRLGDYKLAFSDIFGGNAFLPVLFLLAVLLSGQSVLPHANNADIYLAGLGALLTTAYICGLIFRPRRQILSMGIDSFTVLILYLVGLLGLILVARG